MFKQVVPLKRRPDMSVQQFRDYYENYHSKLHQRVGDGTPFMRIAATSVATSSRSPIR
jgi:hypothetical protein